MDGHVATQPVRQRVSEKLCVLLILVLAAYLRLTHLAHNPGWYTDEATHLNIAQHLLRGQTQYLAISQSFLLFGRMPLFEWLLAGALALGGDGMTTLRMLTGALGVATVGLLYGATRPLSRRLALLAALLLALYPPAILYSRLGFSYNLLAPLVLLVWWGLRGYWNSRESAPGLNPRWWLALAGLALGLGLLSDLWMGVMLGPVILLTLLRRWQDTVWVLPLAAWPVAVYALLQLAGAPHAFLFDLHYTLNRLNAIPLTQQAAVLEENIAVLLRQNGWLGLSLAGLVIGRQPSDVRNRARYLCLGLLLWPIIILGRTVALYSLSFYYMIPLWPLVALGSAMLIERLAHWRWWLALVVAVSFMVWLPATARQIYTGFVTPIDDFLINPADAHAAAQFANQHSDTDDVIIASPAVAWMLTGHAADFQMAVAATGQATVHLPANIPADRFVFDPRVENARYVIVDNLWRNWAGVQMLAVAAMMQTVAQWPIAFQSGEIVVYRNPSRTR